MLYVLHSALSQFDDNTEDVPEKVTALFALICLAFEKEEEVRAFMVLRFTYCRFPMLLPPVRRLSRSLALSFNIATRSLARHIRDSDISR